MNRIALLYSFLLAAWPLAGAAQTLSGPESIEYHPRLDRTLISNTNGGNILARASDGSLSVFTSAPGNPYGIELLAGTLFVLDSGFIRGYDIDSAVQVMNLQMPGAGFLNGITSNGIDTLYVTDFTNQTITEVDVGDLENPAIGTPVSTNSSTPNGVVFDRAQNRLLIATWGGSAKVLSLDPVTSTTPAILIQTTLSNIDGIALDCNGAMWRHGAVVAPAAVACVASIPHLPSTLRLKSSPMGCPVRPTSITAIAPATSRYRNLATIRSASTPRAAKRRFFPATTSADPDMTVQLHLSRSPGLARSGIPLRASFQTWVEKALHAAGHRRDAELSIRIVDAREGRALNRNYRQRDYATNVLSFPAELPKGVKLPLLGDLVICAPVIAREAREQGKLLRNHFAHMTIHGTLHLIGFDHLNERDAKQMEALETRVLAGFGIVDPWQTR